MVVATVKSAAKHNRATPLLQVVSLKFVPRQAVPCSEPSSRYFHAAPKGERTVGAEASADAMFWKSRLELPVTSALSGFESATRTMPVATVGTGMNRRVSPAGKI